MRRTHAGSRIFATTTGLTKILVRAQQRMRNEIIRIVSPPAYTRVELYTKSAPAREIACAALLRRVAVEGRVASSSRGGSVYTAGARALKRLRLHEF